jgi:hypothetical protein
MENKAVASENGSGNSGLQRWRKKQRPLKIEKETTVAFENGDVSNSL